MSVNARPAATAARSCHPLKVALRGYLVDRAEPVDGDRAADLDTEHEAEQLHERARRVRDARLQVLGRQLAHADRERHAREERHERGQGDEVRRCVEAELGEHRRAEAGSDGGDRRRYRLGAHDPARCDGDRPHHETHERGGDRLVRTAAEDGVSAAPASAYAASSSGHGRRRDVPSVLASASSAPSTSSD